MSKRILIFSLGYYPHMVGGAEIAIKEITDRIDPHDTVFDMITLRYDSRLPKYEKIGNIHVYRIGFTKSEPTAQDLIHFPLYLTKVWYPVGAFFKALALHRAHPYDMVWSMMSYMGFPALFFKYIHRRVRFVLTLQEGDTISHVTKRWRIRLVSFWYKRIFRKADVVQVISTYLEGFARDMGFKGRVEVIPNGVDIEHFSKWEDNYELYKAKEEFGKQPEDVFLITTSRLVPKNAVDVLIESLTFLPKNVKLIIAGNGHLEPELKKQVEERKLTERVFFLGYVPHALLPKYLKLSDIFVRPSLSEGMGNSFLEAMAAGIPVIATSVGGIRDFLKDGETGLSVEVHNPHNIAQKVEKLIKDTESRDYIVRTAKAMVVEKYGWDLIALRMLTTIFKV